MAFDKINCLKNLSALWGNWFYDNKRRKAIFKEVHDMSKQFLTVPVDEDTELKLAISMSLARNSKLKIFGSLFSVLCLAKTRSFVR